MADLISVATLTRLKAINETAMPSTVAVERVTRTRRSDGTWTEAYSPHIASVRCRVTITPAPGPGLTETTDRLASVYTYTLAFPFGTDIKTTDRITLPDGNRVVVGQALAGSYSTSMRVGALLEKSTA